MKYTLTIVLCFITLVSFSQKTTDENGRPLGAKPSFAVSSVADVFLTLDKEAQGIKIDYSLPTSISSGKIVLFHPKRDEELKTYTLNSESGSITVDVKSLPVTEFSAGLYDNQGKFLKSLNVH